MFRKFEKVQNQVLIYRSFSKKMLAWEDLDNLLNIALCKADRGVYLFL